MSGPLAVTVGAGKNRPQGRRCVIEANGAGPVRALQDWLSNQHPDSLEGWWSGHVWADNYRDGKNWQPSQVVVIDVDYQNADGEHDSPDPEQAAALEHAAESGKLNGNIQHLTPRGARVVFVLVAPVMDPESMKRTIQGAAELVSISLVRNGLSARPGIAGFVVDTQALDLARFFYLPACIVGEKRRMARVIRMRESPHHAGDLAAHAPRATAGAAPAKVTPSPATPVHTAARTSDRTTAYFAAALIDEAASVAIAPKGQRNDTLNRAAFNLGRLVAGIGRDGDVDRVEAELVIAADKCGYIQEHGAASAVSTIRSGLRKGFLQPRGLPPEPAAPSSTPTVDTTDSVQIEVRPEIGPVVDEAEAALLRQPEVGIYVRGRRLVRIVRDKGRPVRGFQRAPGAPVIEALPAAALREKLASAARWVKHDGRAKGLRPALPPSWVVETLMERERWDFPILEGVVESPALRPDGSLLDRPGYDETTGLLLEPSGVFPPVPESPTPEQVVAAVTAIVDPFRDFPFLTRDGRAAAVSGILTLVGRHAINGPVPLHAARANAPGTGKGLLVDTIAMIPTGRPAARMVPSKDDDESRKRILAIALEGDPIVLLDNVDGALGSPSLASALTASEWTDRLLGSSTKSRAPLRAVWFATGNGLVFRGDLGRRVLPIDLDVALARFRRQVAYAA